MLVVGWDRDGGLTDLEQPTTTRLVARIARTAESSIHIGFTARARGSSQIASHSCGRGVVPRGGASALSASCFSADPRLPTCDQQWSEFRALGSASLSPPGPPNDCAFSDAAQADCQVQRHYGQFAVALDYGVRFTETCVSSRPGPSAVGLPVVFTCTRPNVSTNTQSASKRAIRPRNSVSTS